MIFSKITKDIRECEDVCVRIYVCVYAHTQFKIMREGLIKKATFQQRVEGNEQTHNMNTQKKRTAGRGTITEATLIWLRGGNLDQGGSRGVAKQRDAGHSLMVEPGDLLMGQMWR